jgi:hypothetical protein
METLFIDVSPIIYEFEVTDKLRIETLFMETSPLKLDVPLTSSLFKETLKKVTKLVLLPIIILFDESIIKLLIYIIY